MLPELSEIKLLNISLMEPKEVNNFLESSLPEKINKFRFNCGDGSLNVSEDVAGSKYYDSLCQVLRNDRGCNLQDLYICSTILRYNDFEGLLWAASNWFKVSFHRWTINSDTELDLSSIQKSNINTLDFYRYSIVYSLLSYSYN